MKPYLELLRPHQYVKNVLIFAPIFFAQKLTDIELLFQNILGFICFCMVASAVYILNDYKDLEEDKQHPKKKLRPLASGTAKPKIALSLSITLALLGCGFSFIINLSFFYILLCYLGMNIIYSLGLKHVSLIDVYVIAIGFLLRIYAGSTLSNAPASMWIILITFSLALFIALAKRRDDLWLVLEGQRVRKSLDGYNLEFVNASMIIMAPVILICYIFYTISSDVTKRFQTDYLYLTVLFVILGVLRYLQITLVLNKTGNPTEVLFKDRFLQVTIIAWIGTFIFLIY